MQVGHHSNKLTFISCRNCAGNRVFHIQRLVRGYLCRKKVFSLLLNVQEQRVKDRKAAKIEIDKMAIEDKLSLSQEEILRGDIELQTRIKEEKKARIKAENDRKKKVLFDSAAAIQKLVRGFITRIRCRRFEVFVISLHVFIFLQNYV